jgi:DNA-binding NarL/FixJ family response regulator
MPILTILIEDSETIRDALIPSMAEMANAQVIAFADTSASALEALNEHSSTWQLAVVDLFLKQGNGLTVLKGCRERRPDQHVVVLSNHATQDIRRRCTDAGADAIFDKSTELEAFFDYVQNL